MDSIARHPGVREGSWKHSLASEVQKCLGKDFQSVQRLDSGHEHSAGLPETAVVCAWVFLAWFGLEALESAGEAVQGDGGVRCEDLGLCIPNLLQRGVRAQNRRARSDADPRGPLSNTALCWRSDGIPCFATGERGLGAAAVCCRTGRGGDGGREMLRPGVFVSSFGPGLAWPGPGPRFLPRLQLVCFFCFRVSAWGEVGKPCAQTTRSRLKRLQ